MTLHNNHAESGNVFVFILLGVVLFAALSFSIARGFRSDTTSTMSNREVELAASDIISYAQRVSRAVDHVRRKGCSESEISFENAFSGGHTFATRDKCKIFHPDGGNMSYTAPNPSYLDTSFSAQANYGLWRLNGGIPVQDVGTSASELIFELNYLKEDICMKINDRADIDNPSDAPPVEPHDAPAGGYPFAGSFGAPQANILGDDIADIAEKTAFCRDQTTQSGNNQFNYVVLVR